MGGPYDFPWPRGGCHHDQTGMLAPAVGRTSPPHPLLAMSPCASSEALTIAHLFSTRDIAETKAKEAIDLAKEIGFPLMFKTEPEE